MQGARSACLHELAEFFGVGGVSINRRHDNHKEDLYRYQVNGRRELLEVIVPFFGAHPLRTAKAVDFELFAQCLEICRSASISREQGLIEIAEVAERMNHRKSRKELIGILRGHTPDTLVR